MNPFIFREYDIRGIVDQDLTDESVELIGRGYATYLKAKGVSKISIGGDVRLSSERFINILCKAASESGLDVVNIGFVPTPVSYYSMFYLDIGGSIMVTGSHNPAEFNGFKLGIAKTTIYGEEIQKVLKIIQKGEFASGNGNIEKMDIIPSYSDYLKEKFRFDKKLKIVVDAGNGTAALFVPELFRDMGIDVEELYCEVDGNFPNHHPDPTVEKNLQDLIKKVAETNADFGVAYDGDSDRIGIVDNTGEIIWGDYLLLIYALDILKSGKNEKVIFEVKCSQALTEEISKAGGTPIMWKTGHSLLKNKMKEVHAAVAGEMSGHMFFADRYFGYDDAIYATLRLVEIIIAGGVKLSEIRETLPKYYSTPEIRCEVKSDTEKFELTKKAVEYFSANYKTINIDGVRILFDGGWGLIRSSNTQPILVLRFEANSEGRLQEIKSIVIEKLKEFGDVQI